MDIDASFSLELTRRAAHYLVEHLEHPGKSLPAGADDFAKLVAWLVIESRAAGGRPGRAADRAPPARQEPARRARSPTPSAPGEPVASLAAERQRVQDEIRHRLV